MKIDARRIENTICGMGNYILALRHSASFAPRIPIMPCGMDQRLTALERAFQLARSGRVAGISEIVTSLNREGYAASQIEGRLLKRQLADLIKAAREASVDSTPTQ
jgi:hypothetical protein